MDKIIETRKMLKEMTHCVISETHKPIYKKYVFRVHINFLKSLKKSTGHIKRYDEKNAAAYEKIIKAQSELLKMVDRFNKTNPDSIKMSKTNCVLCFSPEYPEKKFKNKRICNGVFVNQPSHLFHPTANRINICYKIYSNNIDAFHQIIKKLVDKYGIDIAEFNVMMPQNDLHLTRIMEEMSSNLNHKVLVREKPFYGKYRFKVTMDITTKYNHIHDKKTDIKMMVKEGFFPIINNVIMTHDLKHDQLKIHVKTYSDKVKNVLLNIWYKKLENPDISDDELLKDENLSFKIYKTENLRLTFYTTNSSLMVICKMGIFDNQVSNFEFTEIALINQEEIA